jgi:fatty acid CoA ligase FadD36
VTLRGCAGNAVGYRAAVSLLARLTDPTQPDRPDAVVVAGRSLSTGRLVGAAQALAGKIAGAGVVAVDAGPSLETVVAVLAGLFAGVAVVPVAPDAGPLERDHVLSDSGASILLTTSDTPAPGAGGAPAEMAVDIDATAGLGTALPPVPADSPALILYTSGTTGPPKGAVLSRRAIAADLDALADAWAWDADDVLVHGLPLFHVHGLVLGVLGALHTGGRVVHTGRPTPPAIASAVEGGGTLVFGVPTVWARLADDPSSAALRRARLLVSGSAALPLGVLTSLQERCGQVPIERYGMTETLITVSVRADGPRRPGRVGLPLTGVETRLVGEDGRIVDSDGTTVGSLQVRGATLMDGYRGQPELTAAAFSADGWFVTGDAATLDPDGYHRIVGRESTDVINTGGFRVGAGEVEDALLSHPAVREAAVLGAPDDDLGQVIVAWVVADGTHEAALVAWVADRLSAHKRPRRVVLADSLPRNAMGKVQKTLLAGE